MVDGSYLTQTLTNELRWLRLLLLTTGLPLLLPLLLLLSARSTPLDLNLLLMSVLWRATNTNSACVARVMPGLMTVPTSRLTTVLVAVSRWCVMRVLPTMPAVAANSEDSALPTRRPLWWWWWWWNDLWCDPKKTKYKRCMFFFQHRRLHWKQPGYSTKQNFIIDKDYKLLLNLPG